MFVVETANYLMTTRIDQILTSELVTETRVLPQILATAIFGLNNRYQLTVFLTRFNAIEYHVQDAQQCINGRLVTVRQTDSFEYAIANLTSELDFNDILKVGDKFIYNNHPYRFIGSQHGESLLTGDLEILSSHRIYTLKK